MSVDDRAIQEELGAHTERNAALVKQIKGRGGDIDRERSIDVFFQARDEDVAIKLAGFLKSEGFSDITIDKSEDEGDHPWNVQGSITRSVSNFTSPAMVEFFVGVAAGFGVIFDGWGTALDELPPAT